MRSQTAPHELFFLQWVTLLLVIADIMHVKHLGIDMNLAGSVLWLLCYGGVLGGTFVITT